MKKTILTLLTSCAILSSFADGNMTWLTILRPLPCPGGHGTNMPTTIFSSEFMTNTWYMDNTNFFSLVRLPVPLTAGNWTVIDEGTINAGPGDGHIRSSKWHWVESIVYDAACCTMHSNYNAFEMRDTATFWGDAYNPPTNTVTITNILVIPQGARGMHHVRLQTYHGTGTWREQDPGILNAGTPHYCVGAPGGPRFWLHFSPTSNIPTPILMKLYGDANVANTTGLLYTNANLDTNWTFATSFQFDTNGEAELDTSNWLMPTNAGFFKLSYTNNP